MRKYILLIVFFLGQQVVPADSVLDIPYSHQWRTYSCGQNSFRMVMGFWGERLEKGWIFFLTGYNASHSRMFEEIVDNHFPDFAFREVDKNIAAVIETLNQNRPIMIEVVSSELPYLDYSAAAGHYIVALGYNEEDGVIYIRDPNSFYVEALSYAQLEKAWGNEGYTLFAIYREDGQHVAPQELEHFSSEARPFGAKKEDHYLPFATVFIPTIYTALHIGIHAGVW